MEVYMCSVGVILSYIHCRSNSRVRKEALQSWLELFLFVLCNSGGNETKYLNMPSKIPYQLKNVCILSLTYLEVASHTSKMLFACPSFPSVVLL